MEYTIYGLEFFNGVRFGRRNLDSTDISFHADTLFAALFQEALKLCEEKRFLEMIEQNKLIFSDGFPYTDRGKKFFLPKPLLQIQSRNDNSKGDSREKKKIKNMKYIPQDALKEYQYGKLSEEQMKALDNLGKFGMKVSVGIRGNEEPEPYRVSSYYFSEGNGLYIILGYEKRENKELLEALLESLSYTGIGGKKSSGFGKFSWREYKMPDELKKHLQKKGKINILLSTALPEEKDLELVLEDANYSLIKRGGFIDSEKYAEQQMRKAERYVFAPGSCFSKTFSGTVHVEKKRGTHPIFRYEKALFLGVDT